MSEIFLPTTVEKLKICEAEIRNFAKTNDDDPTVTTMHAMARTAMAHIVPEMDLWKGTQVEVATDLARYTMTEGSAHDREVREDDPFLTSGIFDQGAIQEVVTTEDDEATLREYQLCLKFLPAIRSSQSDLVLAESIMVPVSSLLMIDRA